MILPFFNAVFLKLTFVVPCLTVIVLLALVAETNWLPSL